MFQKRNIFKNNFNKLVIISLLILCIVLMVYYKYYRHIQNTIFNESSIYLEDLSRGISEDINRKINDYYTFLDVMADYLTIQNVNTINDVHNILKNQAEYLNFQELLFVDSDSIGYKMDGQTLLMKDDPNIQKTIVDREKSISSLSTINQKDIVVLTTPVNNITLNGKTIVAMGVVFDAQDFHQMLSLSSFKERASSYIIDLNGELVIGPSPENSNDIDIDSYHFLNNHKDSIIDKLTNLKNENSSGLINFNVGDKYIAMTYNHTKFGDAYLLTFVSGTVAFKQSVLLLNTTQLFFGGILCISLLLANIIAVIYRRYRLKLENIAFVDSVTGGNTLQGFYTLVKELLPNMHEKRIAIVYTNIRNFKMLNDQLGQHNCDKLLAAISQSIQADLTNQEIVGRVSADHFCVFIQYRDHDDLYNRFAKWYLLTKQRVETDMRTHWMHPEMEFGVYVIEDGMVPLQQMVDRAKLALRDTEAIPNSRIRFALYNDQLRCKLLREQQIETIMEDSLRNGEFQVYLQPKYSTIEEKIVGAEALTRWKNEIEGDIYPDEFIPIFEKNGFIIQLDLWIFEEVCRLLRDWLDQGKEPIKISVNCSRVHFKTSDFVEDYIRIAQLYNIPRNLIEIEVTENLVLENMNRFIKIVNEIKQAGFGCSVDDFGVGYSSLSLIKDISADTLKLDKVFFRYSKQDEERAVYVISSIISMAKALSMKTVAEGVEDREQVEMLKRLGCDYIQGYVFAKPMPVKDFEHYY